MRRRQEKDWFAELWILGVNFVLALIVLIIGWLLPDLIPEGAEFLAVATVSSITFALLIVKKDIAHKIEDHLEVYRLLESIDDNELREIGVEKLTFCKRQLSELSRGIISGPTTDLLELLAQKIQNASHIQVSHVAISTDEVHGWAASTTARNYYQSNLQILQMGKSVERVFILRRESFVNPNTGKFDESSKDVIEQQERDGVKVYIVWEEDLKDRSLWEDFVIIDSELVYINEPTGAVFAGGWKTLIKKSRQDVAMYKKKYRALIANYSQSPSQIINSSPNP